ncbi:hypothetical protein VTP01DRAFT_10350 [Rhizomucor pusillus]|uniref:uncharacterized protein n=1 Tax=Rhizomucor pusillus TaxID=4840 RepID=UPI003743B079
MTVDNYFLSSADEYTQLLTELHTDYCRDQPEDVLQYCANFFNRKLEEQRAVLRGQRAPSLFGTEHHPLAAANGGSSTGGVGLDGPTDPGQNRVDYMDSDDHREEDDDEDDEFADEYDDEFDDKFITEPFSTMPPPSYNRDRRTSVSAESMAPSHGHDFVKKVIPKTDDQCERIRLSVSNNFLFRNLDEEQYHDVVNAMSEKRVAAGQTIIEQGGVGDYFYVVESGTFDCYISKGGEPPNKVTSYEAGGSFGELALMYNAPRAATIVATSDAVLWALDRVTFRTILMENTSRKRRMYESFLEEVPLLKSLESYERHKIADALESVYFEDGQAVVTQGDIGDRFYIIEAGQAAVYKTDLDGMRQEVNALGRGSYFGELALLNDTPRAATVVAQGRLKCATLGKKAFTRLLGPVLEILKRNSENYHAIINQQEER